MLNLQNEYQKTFTTYSQGQQDAFILQATKQANAGSSSGTSNFDLQQFSGPAGPIVPVVYTPQPVAAPPPSPWAKPRGLASTSLTRPILPWCRSVTTSAA